MSKYDPSRRVFLPHNGVTVLRREVGRIRVRLTCPFCGDDVETYLWSLAGNGKRCPCGALLGQIGAHAKER